MPAPLASLTARCRTGVLAAGFAIGLVVGLTGCGDDAPPVSNGLSEISVIAAADRSPAPAMRGDLLAGGVFSLGEHAGSVVVVNFWGAWCAPCVAEADELEQAYRSIKDKGVVFLGVNVRDQRDSASRFLVAHDVTYPTVFDPPGRLALGFAVPPAAIPSTLVIDRAGRVAVVVHGPVVRTMLLPVLEKLAAEPRP